MKKLSAQQKSDVLTLAFQNRDEFGPISDTDWNAFKQIITEEVNNWTIVEYNIFMNHEYQMN